MINCYEHNGMFPVVLIVWDVSTTSHGTVGWDGHLGLGVLCMGHLGIPTVCPLLPMVPRIYHLVLQCAGVLFLHTQGNVDAVKFFKSEV